MSDAAPKLPSPRGNPNWVKGMQTPNPHSGDLAKVRVMKRLGNLSMRAVQVLEDALSDPDPRLRVVAAKEILDRRFGKPKQEQEVTVQGADLSAMHLAALKMLAEQGLRSLPEPGPLLDVTPDDQAS